MSRLFMAEAPIGNWRRLRFIPAGVKAIFTSNSRRNLTPIFTIEREIYSRPTVGSL